MKITPEVAKNLLEAATKPVIWFTRNVSLDGSPESDWKELRHLSDDPDLGDMHLIYGDYNGQAGMDPADADLAAAAPALAELVAGLRYEYAAHFRKNGYDFWVGNDTQAPVFKAQAERYEAYAYWDTSREVVERLARQLSEQFTVFRRLAGRREVIE